MVVKSEGINSISPVPESIPGGESLRRAEIKDVFEQENLSRFKEQLYESKGKAMFVVHPFFEAGRAQWSGYLDSELNDPDSSMGKYWEELAQLLENMQRSDIPVVILQEVPYLGENTMDDLEILEDVHTELISNLGKISSIDTSTIYVIYTEIGSPHPLRNKDEVDLNSMDFIKGRMEKLKDSGLIMGYVAGLHFKPGDGDDFEFYTPAEKPMDWLRKKPYEETYGDWRLYDYYESKGQINHPLAKIRPDHCVGEFIRELASNDIKPAVTSHTYPEKLGRSSDYEKVEYKSEHAPDSSPQKVFKKKP